MRARMALFYSGIKVELREILLRDKPKEMLALSPKGTVPVLVLPDNTVIDESRDIMLWVLEQHDPDNWYTSDLDAKEKINKLIDTNDNEFKSKLDRYKYADRYPELTVEQHRQQCDFFLVQLETKLTKHQYLTSDQISMADIAIMPFIRQFSRVDVEWFEQSKYKNLNRWLAELSNNELFQRAMQKFPVWQAGDKPTYL